MTHGTVQSIASAAAEGQSPLFGPVLPLEAVAAGAMAHPDLRILRRVSARRDRLEVARSSLLSGCAVHAVLDGPGDDRRLLGVALRGFLADERGAILEVGTPRRWSAFEVTVEASGDAERRSGEREGEPICDAELSCLLRDAEFVVAHDARRVRAAIERRLPEAADRLWICTARDVPWGRFGLEPGSLTSLSLQSGRFFDAASGDGQALALIDVLGFRDEGGTSVLHAAMGTACRPTSYVEVPPVAPGRETLLAAVGYERRVGSGTWWREVDAQAVEEEVEWLMWEICGGADRPSVRPVTWRSRHALN